MAAPVEKQQHTIAGDAELCLHSFQHCLQQSASVHPRCFSSVEDQLARFSVWTANIGVFAPGRSSMDHRLKEVPDVQDIVKGILEVLDDRIQNCSAVLKTLDNSRPMRYGVAEFVENENLDRSVRAIANEISLLHRLSNTIRRASKHSQNVKATKLFQIKDDKGNNVEQFIQERFAFYLLDPFPALGEVIRQRLASTMLLRRKRILYRRSRYGHAPIKPSKTISQPTVTLPFQQQTVIAPEQPQRSDAPEVVVKSAQSIVQSIAVTTTTLAPDSFKKASAPSVISATRTVALGNHQDLIFPPAPSGRIKQKYKQLKMQHEKDHMAYLESLRRSLGAGIEGSRPELFSFDQQTSDAEAKLQKTSDEDWEDCIKAIAEVACPFCFYTLPSRDIVDEKKWKAHVKNDLDAYVCLFEECDTPEELYNHSDEWLKHMRRHALRWRCNSKSHGERVFDRRDDYVDHMSKVHKGAFTDAQVRVLAERNARTIGPLFESCPLCGVKEVKGLIEDHIVGHLRSIALKCLPPYQDEGSESSRNEKGSLGTSKPPSRSTIKKDPERYLKPTFDDSDQQQNTQWRHDGGYPAPSPYADWGGYRNYISKFPAGLKDPLFEIAQFSPPFIPGGETSSVLTPSMDPSIDFVEESLFVGVLKSDWRRFEWGFVTEAHKSSQSSENDSIIQSLLKQKREKLSQERIPLVTSVGGGRSAEFVTEAHKSFQSLENDSIIHVEQKHDKLSQERIPPVTSVGGVGSSIRKFFKGLQPRSKMQGVEDGPELIIFVVGATGTGKSSLINAMTGTTPVQISDSLELETPQIRVTPWTFARRRIKLVDTPGFDDTVLSDTAVFKMIADFLQACFGRQAFANGIIYLHRIIGPTAKALTGQNLQLLQDLCGNEMAKVLLVTTFWDLCPKETGERREAELAKNSWAPLIELGCRMHRYRYKSSGTELMQDIISHEDDIIDLQLQIELTQAERSLSDRSLLDTMAGRRLQEGRVSRNRGKK